MNNESPGESNADRDYEILSSPMPRMVVTSILDNPRAVKCPRCWHYHTIQENHDNLCDRCCNVMVNNHQDHPMTPLIKASLVEQRRRYAAPQEVA